MAGVRDEDRRNELLERCFDTFCANGLENTSLQMLAEACGVTNGTLVYHFGTKDNIVTESTALCMAKVEDDFMARAPTCLGDIDRFLDEMPRLTAEMHGSKYRFMYQVYSSPRYREQGAEFFRGVDVRYREYAERLSSVLGMPVDYVQGMTYVFVRACVHYALFGDEDYLRLQIDAIRTSIASYMAVLQEDRRYSGMPAPVRGG